ncbi:IS30 family transposase [Lapidilactobacillus bayanensis]|uniref:IS30 family transposase n=1 Tax=Lapidilactobacillus bayanensis TaxID=2485998 RepID=UPI000F793E57|nr:IS30 family transposase [Lapidilactobacillus bayanensis]
MTQHKNTTIKYYQQLNPEERGMIETLRKQHTSIRQIAHKLQRAPSTICRELKRGAVKQLDYHQNYYWAYYADRGQVVHENNRTNCHANGLLKTCQDFFSSLTIALKAKYRSDGIDGFVHKYKAEHPDKKCPSTPTVYRYINQGLLPLRNSDLPEKLRRRVKGRRSHNRKNKKILGTSIEKRPVEVDERLKAGNWEGDLVKGKRVASEPALMTLTERKTRFELIIKIPNYHAETCLESLQAAINEVGEQYFSSITFDNGSEFSSLAQIKGTQIYFAHPHSPWERGTNENINGETREFIPKGKSLKNYSEAAIKLIQDALNNKPRKILQYQSSKDCFAQFTPA